MPVVLSPTTRFADLPEECNRLGLTVLETSVRTDPQGRLVVVVTFAPTTTTGEPVVIAGTGYAVDYEPPAKVDSRTLDAILADLLERAAATPGFVQRAFLRGGLRVDVKIDGRDTSLQISRDGKDPSAQEWLTVLNHLPYPAPVVEPHVMVHDGRWYRAASWLTPTKETL